MRGRCEQLLVPALAEIGADGAPLFVNLDGWGVDTPLSLVRHVGHYNSSEVLITFHPQWFARFASQLDVAAGDAVFGGTDWRDIAGTGTSAEKRRGLVELYRQKLSDANFTFSLVFEMIDEGGHDLLLVYGTSNDKGLQKMKDAMWSVDKSHGQRFRDPRDTNQLAFELGDNPDFTVLQQQILERLEAGPTTLDSLKRFTLLETVFKSTHAPRVVRRLEEVGRVDCSRARKHEDVIVKLANPALF